MLIQIKEGLKQELMRFASVSSALSYAEMCMAAKNEEKRLAEMRKRQQYDHSRKQASLTPQVSSSQKKGPNLRHPENTTGGNGKTLLRVNPKTAKCHNCGVVGNFQRNCKQPKTESHGGV